MQTRGEEDELDLDRVLYGAAGRRSVAADSADVRFRPADTALLSQMVLRDEWG